MPRLRRPVIALLLGVPVAIGLLGLLVARHRESARKTALALAEAVHATGMEDALRYGERCRDLQDWLILTKSGSAALWLYQCDSDGHLSLWLPKSQREPVSRVLRDMQWGPLPSEADIDRVLSVALDTSLELHVPLQDALLTYMCRQDLLLSKAQRADIEKRIRFLATSSAQEDRGAYAHTQIASDTDSALMLRPLLNDPAELPRACAIYALGQRGDPSLKPILPSLLDDPSGEVRRAAWSVQSRYDAPELLPMLWRCAKSSDSEKRAWALVGLYRRKVFGKAHVPLLRSLLRDPNSTLRSISAVQLGRFKDTDSLPIVRLLLDSPDPYEREAGIIALWWLEDRASFPRMRQLANELDPGSPAREVLRRYDPDYKPALQQPLEFLQGLPFQGFQH